MPWEHHYNSNETKDAVKKDLLLVKHYSIQGVPSLIINGEYQISGAQPLAQIIQAIRSV